MTHEIIEIWGGLGPVGGNYKIFAALLIRSPRNFRCTELMEELQCSWNDMVLNQKIKLDYTLSKTLIRKRELPGATNCITLLSLFTVLENMLAYVQATGEIPILILAGSTKMKTTISLCYIIWSPNEDIWAPLCFKPEDPIIFTYGCTGRCTQGNGITIALPKGAEHNVKGCDTDQYITEVP